MGIVISHIIGYAIIIFALLFIIAIGYNLSKADFSKPFLSTDIKISVHIKDDDEIDSGKSKSNKGENKTRLPIEFSFPADFTC